MNGSWTGSLFIILCLACSMAAAHRQEKPGTESAPAARGSEPPQANAEPKESSQHEKATPPTPAKTVKKRRSPKRIASPQPAGTPRKTVVREGGVDEPSAQIVTGISPEEAAHQRQDAELLLSTTEEMLKEIAPRTLDAQQEETVSQIHTFMKLSRGALKEGDVARAHTLAQKANLLADDLRKH